MVAMREFAADCANRFLWKQGDRPAMGQGLSGSFTQPGFRHLYCTHRIN
jgi:hypothetical protein